ncbi:MAG: sulfatase [Candidatus Eisenbacteria bacterium]|nr:sulfatase [Candidatus Eisenbacteria bacterium]
MPTDDSRRPFLFKNTASRESESRNGSFEESGTQRSARARAGSYGSAPLVGALIGWTAAGCEIIYLASKPASVITRADWLECALLYALTGAALGLLLSALMRLVRRRPPSIALSVAMIGGLFAFLLIGGYVNLYRLPEATSRTTIVPTLLMFGAAVVASALVWLGLRAATRRARHGAGLQKAGWIALGILFLVTAGISLLPARRSPKAAASAEGQGPNVLLLTADALRSDHLSLYGYSRKTSPNLDAWAREAIVFDHAFAQSSWTKPSTATILTGLYPSIHRVNLPASGLPPSAESLFETLSRAGYATGLFAANSFVTPLFGFGRGVERVHAPSPPHFTQFMLGHLMERAMEWSAIARAAARQLIALERAARGGGLSNAELTGEKLQRAFFDWIDAGRARPFFAYIHYMETHAPYDPPPPDDARFLPERLQGMRKVKDFPRYEGFLPFQKGRAMSADSLACMVALYDGAILHFDRLLGTLIEELKRRGLYERTLIILTADHGEEFFEEHGGWGHGHSLYEELLRVPLVVSCPALFAHEREPGERRVASFVRHVDLAPTILDLCRIPSGQEYSGISLAPLLRSPLDGAEAGVVDDASVADGASTADDASVGNNASTVSSATTELFSEVDHGGHGACALRSGTEKAILARWGSEERFQLFDLAHDPLEQQDLSAERPDRAAHARAALEAFRANVLSAAREEVTVTMDEATRERLRGLGYIR